MDSPPPPPSTPPLPQKDRRPSFNRSRSQQILQDPTRHFNTLSGSPRTHHGFSLEGTTGFRAPASMPAGAPPSPATVGGTAASAFAAIQKICLSKEDINFWSTLYAQHRIHTRQDYQASQGTAMVQAPSSEGNTSRKGPGPIKVWQVLTKTVLEDDNDQIHFERLPIKVQTSASALSPDGRPFSIVFFFTVESTPTTLWYLESAFTQSATVHEHMELMGTFQPNDPKDAMSFYIYETHTFNIVQPTHEDTMLDIHVQSPAGVIYAEFSYTFVKEPRHIRTASTVSSSISAPHSPQLAIDMSHSNSATTDPDYQPQLQLQIQEQLTTPLSPLLHKASSQTLQSPLDSYDVIEPGSPTSLGYFPRQQQEQEQEQEQDNTIPSPQASMPTLVRSHLEDNLGVEESSQELITGTSSVEEPDAGEHFMQATSEFFSKVGYWLYNSRVVQYIARDDRIRTKTVFPADDIWILGVCYTFEPNEPPCSIPEASRPRKTSALQAQMVPGRMAELKNSASSIHAPVSDNARDMRRGWERKIAHAITSPKSSADNDTTFATTTTTADGLETTTGRSRSKERHMERQREKEQAKAKRIALAREREMEREERAREKARIKGQEKMQKLKSRISHPQFDQSNLRDGTRDLAEILAAEQKQASPHSSPPEKERKSRSMHGYQHEDRTSVGLGLTTPSGEPKQSVIRRMRSISILQKVPSAALDLLAQKKGLHESEPRFFPPDRSSHQPRSQSISSFSVFSQRSAGVPSFSSHEGPPVGRPISPPPPSSLKSSMSVHEALAVGPRPTVLSKLSQLNLSQKKLPDLPFPHFNDMPDIPVYQYQDPDNSDFDDSEDHAPAYAPAYVPPVPHKDAQEPPASPTEFKTGRRRMTISSIFSKDAKPSASSGIATLKSLVNGSKISLRPKAEDMAPVPRAQSPLSSGSAVSTTISFGPHLTGRDGLSSAKKGGVSKNMQHWIERRLSSNNLHQQVFVASTDEPVPPVSKDSALSPPGSPLGVRLNDIYDGGHGFEQNQEKALRQQQTRARKKSSIFSTTSSSSTVSSPKSALKPSSPQSPPLSKIRGPVYSPTQSAGFEMAQVEDAPRSRALGDSPLGASAWSVDGKPYNNLELEPPVEEPPQIPSAAIEASLLESGQMQDPLSFMDLVVLPPLPPESPTEAFILLEQEQNTSQLSLERGPEGSVLVSMSGTEDTSIEEDPIRVQNRRLFDQLAEFSNDKRETVSDLSDLRSEWESLWPSKQEIDRSSGQEITEFVHVKRVQSERPIILRHEELPQHERERIREIGSAYVKVKGPRPEIVAPQPKTPVMLQSQAFQEDVVEDVLRAKSPEEPTGSSDDKKFSAKDRLLHLPPAVITALPQQTSPSSPSSSLTKSWKAVSPRSESPKRSIPLVSSSTSTSSRSTSAQATSSGTVKEEHGAGIDIPSAQVEASSFKAEALLSAPQSISTHLSLEMSSAATTLSPNQATLVQFMSDFQSRLWFTYRKDLARIEPSFFNSDAGWGCMMRTGQSLLAQAFVQVLLGRDWRAQGRQAEQIKQQYRTLLGWFADEPERHYSLHNIAKAGVHLGKQVGEWFGPSTVAHALKRISEKHANNPLTIMVPMDNSLRASEIVRAATEGQVDSPPTGIDNAGAIFDRGTTSWKPVVLLMPARFGLEKLTERYTGNLKQLFRLPQFLGIAGGRPGRSLYFVASQGSELFYFDPHFVKPRATQEELSHFPSASYHCNIVRSMDIMEMDPSMLLGFLVQSANDLADLCLRLKNDMERGYPLLTILEDVPLQDLKEVIPEVTADTSIPPKEETPAEEPTPPTTLPALIEEVTHSYTTLEPTVTLQEVNAGREEDQELELELEHEEEQVYVSDTARQIHIESYEFHISSDFDADSAALDRRQNLNDLQPPQDAQDALQDVHQPLSLSVSHGQQDEETAPVPRSKREMKRITKALKSEMKLKNSKDKKTRAASDLYEYRYASKDSGHVHDQDTLSVHSFDSEASL